MEKIPFIRLWDIYKGLLTPTQQEITDMYFNLDLTPSEIADEKGITRQAVSECLKTCKKQLEEYEEKVGISKRLNDFSLSVSLAATEIKAWAEEFSSSNPAFKAECDKLVQFITAL